MSCLGRKLSRENCLPFMLCVYHAVFLSVSVLAKTVHFVFLARVPNPQTRKNIVASIVENLDILPSELLCVCLFRILSESFPWPCQHDKFLDWGDNWAEKLLCWAFMYLPCVYQFLFLSVSIITTTIPCVCSDCPHPQGKPAEYKDVCFNCKKSGHFARSVVFCLIVSGCVRVHQSSAGKKIFLLWPFAVFCVSRSVPPRVYNQYDCYFVFLVRVHHPQNAMEIVSIVDKRGILPGQLCCVCLFLRRKKKILPAILCFVSLRAYHHYECSLCFCRDCPQPHRSGETRSKSSKK